MVIFHSHVSLPEGKTLEVFQNRKSNEHCQKKNDHFPKTMVGISLFTGDKSLVVFLVKLRRVHACGVDCGEGKPLAMQASGLAMGNPKPTGENREFEWENHRAKWRSVKNVHVFNDQNGHFWCENHASNNSKAIEKGRFRSNFSGLRIPISSNINTLKMWVSSHWDPSVHPFWTHVPAPKI